MHDDGTDSRIKIFANIFISFIGAGILGLPYAFKEVGHVTVRPEPHHFLPCVPTEWHRRGNGDNVGRWRSQVR